MPKQASQPYGSLKKPARMTSQNSRPFTATSRTGGAYELTHRPRQVASWEVISDPNIDDSVPGASFMAVPISSQLITVPILSPATFCSAHKNCV